MCHELNMMVVEDESCVVIGLAGSASLGSVDEMEKQFDRVVAASPNHVTLDLRQLRFISSLGMGLILSLAQRLRANGGTLRLINLQPRIREMFEMTYLTRVLDICESNDLARQPA